MRKVLLTVWTLTSLFFFTCKDNPSEKVKPESIEMAAKRDAKSTKYPVIEFDKTEVDFGQIEARQNVKTEFSYKNVGDAPLVITNISSSCGCTIPKDWSREPLAPGESGKFTVNFNGSGNGNVAKTVTITANTEKGRETVKIKTFVKPDPKAPKRKAVSPNKKSKH